MVTKANVEFEEIGTLCFMKMDRAKTFGGCRSIILKCFRMEL